MAVKPVVKTWELTLNNYEDRDLEVLRSWTGSVSRMTVAKEIGATGTPHLQAQMTFKRGYRLPQLKKLLPRGHWEVSKAPQDDLYCRKLDSDVVIDVDNRSQGKRSDLVEIAEAVKSGATIRQLYIDFPASMIRYGRGIRELHREMSDSAKAPKFALADFPMWQPITDWRRCHILWGSAGTGKTQFAKAHFRHPLVVSHADDLQKFQPEVHDGIVFDDMSFNHLPRESQIHLVDNEEDRSIHCRFVNATIPAGTKKLFTTNVCRGAVMDICDAAIKRRITVHHLEGPLRE